MIPLLGRWFAKREAAAQARWVVVDCETSGLDPGRDRLLAIGAVAVRSGRIGIAEVFARQVRQETPSDAANILVHGIGAQAQAAGEDPARVMEAFARYVGGSPLAAFHAPFDRAILERTAREQGLHWRGRWLDVAELLAVLFSARAKRSRSLDGWLHEFGIAHDARHDALGDAFATAQLLQVALEEARRHGFLTVRELLRAGVSGRWAAP